VVFKAFHSDFLHFFEDFFKVILYLPDLLYREHKYTAILISYGRSVSACMFRADAMNLSKDIAIAEVAALSVLDDGFQTWLLNSFVPIILLLLLHFLLMDSPQELLVLDKVICVYPQFDLA
jgi:hypothetical protein